MFPWYACWSIQHAHHGFKSNTNRMRTPIRWSEYGSIGRNTNSCQTSTTIDVLNQINSNLDCTTRPFEMRALQDMLLIYVLIFLLSLKWLLVEIVNLSMGASRITLHIPIQSKSCGCRHMCE